jgi:hypothetical protein
MSFSSFLAILSQSNDQYRTIRWLERYQALRVPSNVRSSEVDGEGGEGSACVAAVVAQRCGEVNRPGVAERASGEAAQATTCGPALVPVRSW